MKRKRKPPESAPQALPAPGAPDSEECWRLPSGESLAEFALHAGFVGSLMMASRAVSAAGEGPLPAGEAEPQEEAAPVRTRRSRRPANGR